MGVGRYRFSSIGPLAYFSRVVFALNLGVNGVFGSR